MNPTDSDFQAGRNALPIGVFDSGMGGLTVLRALRARMPGERFLYLGDTARLPYGTKSRESITRYSLQAAELLIARGIKCLVVACNTAAATALDALRAHYPSLPLLGVVEPGAEAGSHATRSGAIAVIATESTVQGGAYQRAIRQRRADARVIAVPCSLFVPLAEEGWTNGPIVEAVAHRYLDAVFSGGDSGPDTLLLGCTHFPVLRSALRNVVGEAVTIVDSAETTATALQTMLERERLCATDETGGVRLLATDGRQRFARVGALFLDHALDPDEIELVDLSPRAA
jgi:glutamate racemase